jgi:four helix bundle protein
MQDYRRIALWQRAHALALAVYKVTRRFPSDERYGLASQLRRASVSVTANIAEGRGRGGDRELARFLRIALGSATELSALLLLARDLNLVGAEDHAALDAEVVQVRRMLYAFAKRAGGKP